MTFWLDFCNFPRHAFAIQPPCNYASTKKLPEGIGHHIPKTCSHLLAHCGPDSGQVLKYLFIIYHIHVWANQDDLGIHHQGLRGDQKTKIRSAMPRLALLQNCGAADTSDEVSYATPRRFYDADQVIRARFCTSGQALE